MAKEFKDSDNPMKAIKFKCERLETQRDELLSILEGLLSQGVFFLTAIEAKDSWSSDFEDIERRARSAIAKVKSEYQPASTAASSGAE